MSESKPLFSIVIPAYNYAETLPRAIESVLLQEGDDYEILVVNDGSTDDTVDVIGRLHEEFPGRFRSVTRSNAGLAATRNYGINHTAGDWLIFLDSDDELEAEALSTLRTEISRNPDSRMIVGGHMAIEEDGTARYRKINAKNNSKKSAGDLFTGYLLEKTVTPSNGATAMHRIIFDKIRYPEKFRNSEDIPVFACAFANFSCSFVDKPINRVYKHDDSLRHNITHAHSVGVSLVDKVFDLHNIPESLQIYRKAFVSQRCLSLFRTLHTAGKEDDALRYYAMAIKSHWPAIFKFSYTKKVVRCYLRSKLGQCK